MQPFSISIQCYGIEEKKVGKAATRTGIIGRLNVPGTWVGKHVKVILVEDLNEEA